MIIKVNLIIIKLIFYLAVSPILNWYTSFNGVSNVSLGALKLIFWCWSLEVGAGEVGFKDILCSPGLDGETGFPLACLCGWSLVSINDTLPVGTASVACGWVSAADGAGTGTGAGWAWTSACDCGSTGAGASTLTSGAEAGASTGAEVDSTGVDAGTGSGAATGAGEGTGAGAGATGTGISDGAGGFDAVAGADCVLGLNVNLICWAKLFIKI